MINICGGDIWACEADIRINTVNVKGAMGKGIALEFKKRYPAMFLEYKKRCDQNGLRPGVLDIWKTPTEHIINFPTKQDWRLPSRYEYIESGLVALCNYLRPLGHVTVATPALGCSNGKLDFSRVSKLIYDYLSPLEAEILLFPPTSS